MLVLDNCSLVFSRKERKGAKNHNKKNAVEKSTAFYILF